MVHDQKKYDVWEKFYHYTCSDKIDKTKMEINLKPNPHRVAEVPLFFFVPKTLLCVRDEVVHMAETRDNHRFMPKLSKEVVGKFLALVHQFTCVGMQAQATVFSYGLSGVIKYLTVLPQINDAHSVCVKSKDSIEEAQKKLQELDPTKRFDGFLPHCLLLTHPQDDLFLSPEELLQLFLYSRDKRLYTANDPRGPRFFAIVLNPRKKDIKALCLHLTASGFTEISKYYSSAKEHNYDIKDYVTSQIARSSLEFYGQYKFGSSSEHCQVIDLRQENDILHQMRYFIVNNKANDWPRV